MKFFKISILVVLLLNSFYSTSVLGIEKNQFNDENSFIPVLMYHHFEEGETGSTVVDPDDFKEQLIYLKDLGYETITEKDLLLFLTEGVKLPDKPILITIDDGYLSNYTLAYPILKELEMKATIYVVADWRNKTDGLLYPHFTWEQAKEMVDSGYVDIQSHTYNSHYKATSTVGEKKVPVLSNRMWMYNKLETHEEYEDRVRNDLRLAKEIIEEKVGNEVISLSYPYGSYNDIVEKIALEEGYQMMITIDRGVMYPYDNPYEIKRINVPSNYTGEDIVRDIEYYSSIQNKQGTFIEINNNLLKGKSIQYNNQIYIPLRESIDKLGMILEYNPSSKDVTLYQGNNRYTLKAYSDVYYINEVESNFNSPIIRDGLMYVPLSFFADILKVGVDLR